MKKINKLFFALPITLLPIVSVTSCNFIDFTKAKEYFDENWPVMRQAFATSSNYTKSVITGINQVAMIEDAFINNKVNNYWELTIINLRQESYSSTYWNYLFGSSGKERSKYYEPIKEQLQDEGNWIGSGQNITDVNGNNIDFIHMLATYNAWVCGKGSKLKDLAGWAGDVAQAAHDLKQGHSEMPGFSDEDLYADVDACNIGTIYNNWESDVKTSSLPMYQYYTDLADDKERFGLFFDDILKLDRSLSIEQNATTLMNRMKNNKYLLLYIKTNEMNWNDSGDNALIKQATEKMIERIQEKL